LAQAGSAKVALSRPAHPRVTQTVGRSHDNWQIRDYVQGGFAMTNSLSIFKDTENETKYMVAYDNVLRHWPVPYIAVDIPTRFGTTHINMSGSQTAPPLVLLPGNFTSSTTWFHNVACLSQHYSVYAVDTLGDVGKSIPEHLPASRSDYANWLNDLLAYLKIEKAALMGISYGGFLSVNFALHFPEHVDRLVLLCPGIPIAPFTLGWMIYGMPMLLSSSRWAGEWFLRGASFKGYNHTDFVQETYVIGVAGMRSKSVMRPIINADEWKRIQIPTLLLVGDSEILYNPHRALQRAKQLIPQIETELVPHAGHLLNSDQPEKVGDTVLRFLGANNKSA
jgi:pimeloyl-ACP methyl ester carboxylesterase